MLTVMLLKQYKQFYIQVSFEVPSNDYININEKNYYLRQNLMYQYCIYDTQKFSNIKI